MPLRNYGVLVGAAVDARREDDDDTPHYQVCVRAVGEDHRIAVNVKSQEFPSELLYLVEDRFSHPVVAGLAGLGEGFTALPPTPGGLSLDYIRGNLFDRARLQQLPHSLPGPDNDLSDRLDHYVHRAMAEPGSTVYAFGETWGPEAGKTDKIFGFAPDRGIHDIHMNQGNVGRFRSDDGVWQDGALILHLAADDRWVAIFLAFQSQAWHTDDSTGHSLEVEEPPDSSVLIVGALVNPAGPAPEAESVTLLNRTPASVDLTGWAVADKEKRRFGLSGTVEAGGTLRVPLGPPVGLGNSGGIITLLDAAGLKVHGVSYTRDQARDEGWTLAF